MIKREFLNRLSAALASVSSEERKNILAYYDELINDKIDSGLLESEIIADLGTPESIARRLNVKEAPQASPNKQNSKIRPERIEREYIRYDNVQENEEKKEIRERNVRLVGSEEKKANNKYDKYEKKKANDNKAVLVTILILTSPIWLSLLLAIFIIFLALIITSLAVTLSMFITGVALVIGGIGGCIAGLLQITTPLGIFTFGSGIVCIGLGLILGPICFKLGLIITKGLMDATKWLFNKMFGGRK